MSITTFPITTKDAKDVLETVFNVRNYGGVGNGVTDDATAIAAAFAAAQAAALPGGVVYLPAGKWRASSLPNLSSGILLKGAGQSVTEIWPTANGQTLFGLTGGILDVLIKDLAFVATGFTGITGVACAGTYGVDDRSNGLRFESVRFQECAVGHSIIGTGGGWQMANVSYDEKCQFIACNDGFIYNTINSVIKNHAFFQVNAGQRAGTVHGVGELLLDGEFAGSTYNGREQVERQTIVLAGSPVSGVGQMVITKGGVSHTVYVSLDTAACTTTTATAAVFARAAAADPWASSNFHFSVVGAYLFLINIDREANDTTMNFTIENVTSTIVVNNTTSTNSYTGIAEVGQAEGIIIDGDHGPININAGFAEEGFSSFIRNEFDSLNCIINVGGGIPQGAIRLNAACIVNFTGNQIVDRCIRDSNGCGAMVAINPGCKVISASYFAGVLWPLIGMSPTNFGQYSASNGGTLIVESNPDNRRERSQFTMRRFFNTTDATRTASDAPGEFYATDGNGTRQSVKWGKCDEGGEPLATYGARRSVSDYRTKFEGSQATIYKGYDFDADVTMPQITVGGGTIVSKAHHGTATLVAGVKAVTDATITANTRIFVQRQTDGGTIGASYSITRTAGTSFTITSKDSTGATQTADTSTLAYWTVEP